MRILVAGDFVPRHRVAAQIEEGNYGCLDEAKPVIQSADYAIVNFESPVVLHEANPIDKTGPHLRCTEKAMGCIAQAGFKCVTLANNHFRDYGQVGVEDTVLACKNYGIDYVGGGINLQEAESVLYKEVNGETIAIINACENEWSIATKSHGGSCGLDIVELCNRIKEAHSKANFVLLIIHGGIELFSLPTPRMKKLYRFFAEMGADAIVNHHQHCYSGYETYLGVPIFYGIGNFCFDKEQPDASWGTGYLVSIETQSKEFKIHPYHQATMDFAGVSMMEDQTHLLKELERLNNLIGNDDRLEAEYGMIVSKMKPLWKTLLNPYQGKFLNRLVRKGLLPSFINDYRCRRLFNLVSCESHRERLLYVLNKKLEHE